MLWGMVLVVLVWFVDVLGYFNGPKKDKCIRSADKKNKLLFALF